MDGNHECTVEQLVQTFLITTRANQNAVDGTGNHTETAPPKLYWVHQLDAETSGVLCIALSSNAAAAASKLFATRQTMKEYVSVVHGHAQFPPPTTTATARTKTTTTINKHEDESTLTISKVSHKPMKSVDTKRKRKAKGPIPDFGFFERDKRLALAKATQRDGNDNGSPSSIDHLTKWEQRLLATSWKNIKRLSDAQSDMVSVV